MKNVLLFFLYISGIVALFAFAFSLPLNKSVDGKEIFLNNKCKACHSVETFGITSNKSNPVELLNLSDKTTAEFLSKFLMKTESLNGKEHKLKFKGSDEELKALVDWLLSLKIKQ